ncbi:hypothetical protein [Neisseria zalophi]|uniref:Tetratricopeptide repeat protein n=1 Tax=Neisseria zalophi TaxID=640030 RepID=A0A5J6PV83_9NEIS|nr:hypothetical protein [Neisseria zalophi]QEY26708.1 hypothetical protein D0T92_09325 [Neisseria zalophi]
MEEQIRELALEGINLFESKEYQEAIKKFNEALNLIKDKETFIREQVCIQYYLGNCYFEQAFKEHTTKQRQKKYLNNAKENFQNYLILPKQTMSEDNSIKDLLILSYMQLALITYNEQTCHNIHEAKKYIKELLASWQKSQKEQDEENKEQKCYAYFWLALCYILLTSKTNHPQYKYLYFKQSRKYLKNCLALTKQLNRLQHKIRIQIYCLNLLGDYYLRYSFKNNQKAYFKAARKIFQKSLDLSQDIENKKEKIQQQIDTQYYKSFCDFKLNNLDMYFQWKTKIIKKNLNHIKNKTLKEYITDIQAALSVTVIEIENMCFAHYTNPKVCDLLFGTNPSKGKDQLLSTMRMNSCTYMNDPTEGKSLLDFLGYQELSLENKTSFKSHNAFATCFSARVNDLNQFRLYGKVDNIEASGCCLVFNKNGDWVKLPDMGSAFRLANNEKKKFTDINDFKLFNIESNLNDLPLFQVAYIYKKDEYIQNDEDNTLDNTNKFGIRLKSIGKNANWNKLRKEKLSKALMGLQDLLNKRDLKDNDSKEPLEESDIQNALEYVRYLFKDYAFRDEEEFRRLRIESIDSENIQFCEDTNNIYLEYDDITSMVNEVILGTNYEHTEEKRKTETFRYLLKQQDIDIKVSHSTLPINH